jgi:hypothetical protein
VLAATWGWSFACLASVAPLIWINVSFLVGAGRGIGHSGSTSGSLAAVLLLPTLILCGLFALAFPFFFAVQANRAGLAGALTHLIERERFPLIRGAVGRILDGVEAVAPGVLTGAVRLDNRMVRRAYERLERAEHLPRVFRGLLRTLVRRVDLAKILSLEIKDGGVDPAHLKERAGARAEAALLEALTPSRRLLWALGIAEGLLAAGAWAILGYLAYRTSRYG